ncbi:hypothetical protein MASR2M8_13950 [Opitutaceae bacterium]
MGGECAAKDRHAVALAQGDDVGTQGRGHDEARTGENARAGGLSVEYGAEAKEEVGQFGVAFSSMRIAPGVVMVRPPSRGLCCASTIWEATHVFLHNFTNYFQ